MNFGSSENQVRQTTPMDAYRICEYLEQRVEDPNFVMVEIGHGGLPVAYQQPEGFVGLRAYIGVEAWLRDRYNWQRERRDQEHETSCQGQNIFYISQQVGGLAVYDEENPKYWWLEGVYDPETLLPDEAADEVFVSNVFCDPHVAYSQSNTARLLGETARLLDPSGLIVLRQTITPRKAVYLTDELIESFGLALRASVQPSDVSLWQELEAIYKAEPSNHPPAPGSYYLFLSKSR